MHHRSPRMRVFSETPGEEKFKIKLMLANIGFTRTRKGPFIGEMIIAKKIYPYRHPYYLTESYVIKNIFY